jgi:hypothetical protein
MTVISWVNGDGSTDVVELDIFEVETHAADNELSEFPVEVGLDLTDNIRIKPRTLILEGYVTDIPLPENVSNAGAYSLQSLDLPNAPSYGRANVKLDVPASPLKLNVASLVTAGFNALAGALGFGGTNEATVFLRGQDVAQSGTARVWQPSNQASRVIDVFKLLTKASDTARLCSVVTDFKSYDNMAIEHLEVPRKTDDGSGAHFSVSFKQIRIVSAQTVTAPKPAITAAQKPTSAGSKATEDESSAASTKKKTLLAALLGR